MDGLAHKYTLNLLISHSEQIARLLDMPWLPHGVVTQEIMTLLEESVSFGDCGIREINLAGGPGSQFLYVLDPDSLIIFSANSQSLNQPFIFELINKYGAQFTTTELDIGFLLVARLSDSLGQRLLLPHILLISLFHPEMYPTFRLTLGISSIASFLRQSNCAKVEIVDCQFGTTVTELIQKSFAARPEIIGLSVNFGQYDLMEQFLDGINKDKPSGYDPVIVLGNILPALSTEEILEKYPRVVICVREGEMALAELSYRYQERGLWKQVPNICYKDANGQLIQTKLEIIPLEMLPPPALDTVEALMKRDGVLTAEFSRGCQYNVCTFCPRSHKGASWRTLPVSSMVQQSLLFHKVSEHFQMKTHIFLADEEFVGPDLEEETLRRVYSFFDHLHSFNVRVSFDASCRADQIYDESKTDEWNIKRGYLFRKWLNNGLSRLFVGIESGNNDQLQRYRKGHSVDRVVSAIRYFTLLGVHLRFGFIFFDPLMTVNDVCENIEFLGRDDVVLKEQPDLPVESIFMQVRESHGIDIDMPSGGSVYENVSYMISPLEVLPKSKYLFDLRRQYPQLLNGETDPSFARIQARYLIPEIELLSTICQVWINYCFPVVYALKGLQKVSQAEQMDLFGDSLKEHRYLSYILVRSLAYSLGLIKTVTYNRWEMAHPTPILIASVLGNFHDFETGRTNNDALKSILLVHANLFREKIEQLSQNTVSLPSTIREIWERVSADWLKSSVFDTEAIRNR